MLVHTDSHPQLLQEKRQFFTHQINQAAVEEYLIVVQGVLR